MACLVRRQAEYLSINSSWGISDITPPPPCQAVQTVDTSASRYVILSFMKATIAPGAPPAARRPVKLFNQSISTNEGVFYQKDRIIIFDIVPTQQTLGINGMKWCYSPKTTLFRAISRSRQLSEKSISIDATEEVLSFLSNKS